MLDQIAASEARAALKHGGWRGIVSLRAVKSCSFLRRSCARVRQAWHLAPVVGGPRPAAPRSISVSGPCAARASAPGCGLRRCGCGLDRAPRRPSRPRRQSSIVRCWCRCRPTARAGERRVVWNNDRKPSISLSGKGDPAHDRPTS
jgi:hypothetical protein